MFRFKDIVEIRLYLICNKAGDEIAAIHAGWKSLGTGIIEATLEHFQNTDLHVWLAPAICGNHYEVGQDVFDVYCDHKAELANAFTTSCDKPEHYYLNLQQAAKIILHAHDMRHITDCGHCTYADSNNFYSYRRDGVTGRLGSLIYFE